MQCENCKKEASRLTFNPKTSSWDCCYRPDESRLLSNVSAGIGNAPTLSEAHLRDIRSRRLAEDGRTVIRVKNPEKMPSNIGKLDPHTRFRLGL